MANGQNRNEVTAVLNDSTHTVTIKQKTLYTNTSDVVLNEIYFNDWNHAFSSKKTPLAESFGDAFKRSLHLAKDKDRGITTITSFVDANYSGLEWERTPKQDLIKVILKKPLEIGETAAIFISYTVKLPNAKFTTYGFKNKSEYYLTDWYLTPAVFSNGEWKLYSNVNLDDLYTDVADTKVNITFPKDFFFASNFETILSTTSLSKKQITLDGKAQKSCTIILSKKERFTKHV